MDLLNKQGVPFNQMSVISADAQVAALASTQEQLSVPIQAKTSANLTVDIDPPTSTQAEIIFIDHAFLLYSDQPIDQSKPLQEHYQQTLIIIDPWASKKIVELPTAQSAAELDAIIRNYLDQVMREVDNKYSSKETIMYNYDTPISRE
jgi:hypothetical protein